MSTIRLELDIRRQIAAFAVEEISFERFEDWFLDHTWGCDDAELQELVASVELLIAEFTGGHMTEQDLRERLWPLASGYTTSVAWPAKPSDNVTSHLSGGTVVHTELIPAGA